MFDDEIINIENESSSAEEDEDSKEFNKIRSNKRVRGCFYKKFGISYFKDKRCFEYPGNEDSIYIKQCSHMMLFNIHEVRIWKNKHKAELKNALCQYWRDKKRKSTVSELHNLQEPSKVHTTKTLIHYNDYMKKKIYLENYINNVDGLGYDELCDMYADQDINWVEVCSKYLSLHVSPDTCESAWKTIMEPSVSELPFSKKEIGLVAQLAKEYGEQNWDEIAKKLPTKRSAFQCFVYFKTQIKLTRTPWTKEEDDLLRSYVNFSSKRICWPNISQRFPTRNYNQCFARWKYSLCPGMKRGKITPEEHTAIENGLKMGLSHKEIAKTINRSTIHITNHVSKLNKKSHKGTWKVREILLLIQEVLKYTTPPNWSEISKVLVFRDREQCRHKYGNLKRLGYSDLNTLSKIIIKLYPDQNQPMSRERLTKLKALKAEPTIKEEMLVEECYNILPVEPIKKKRRRRWRNTSSKLTAEEIDPNVETYQCDTCNKVMFTRSGIMYHIRTHSDSRKIMTCPICSKQFNKRSYDIHMTQHAEDAFLCYVCNKTFALKGSLKKHLHTHMIDIPMITKITKSK